MTISIRTLLGLLVLVAAARAEELSQDNKPQRVRLENGVTLLLAPLPEAKIVAVESFYPVGFCDEPAGMIQVAHLLEHLMCQGATKSHGPGESIAMLRKLGMANAETLPTLTHYDFSAPPGELKTILTVEAERLSSLKITPDLIRDEAGKCDDEAEFVYRNPKSGMVKHAFMALYQFWNHGATEVRVRSGLDQLPVDRVEAFYREQYRPDQLTLAIVGNFKKEEAVALAKEHLGAIPARKVEAKSRDWNTAPASAHVTWDVDLPAVCVYAPPPSDPKERALLSLWGTVFLQKLMMQKIGGYMTFATNTTWPAGDLPFFVYTLAKSGDQVASIEQMIKDLLQENTKQLTSDIMQMQMMVKMTGGDSIPTWKQLQEQAAAFAKTTQRTEDEAMGMVLMNVALQWSMRELNGTLAEPDISEAKLKAVLERTLDPTKLKVVTLGPPK